MIDYYSLAPLNSVLNGIATILLTAGFIFIRMRWVHAHRACMLGAVAVSTAFFISYLTYHYHVGDVRFQGHGLVRPVYFTILITHIMLAAAIVPLVLVTLWRALSGNFSQHRRIARWTWPIWMYVSVTGVIVYLMCYRMYPPGYKVPPPAAASATSSTVLPHGRAFSALEPVDQTGMTISLPTERASYFRAQEARSGTGHPRVCARGDEEVPHNLTYSNSIG